jgi:hypothetical protein
MRSRGLQSPGRILPAWKAVSITIHCQQAAEKALKAPLAWHDEPFRRNARPECSRRAAPCPRAGTASAACPTLGND